MINPILLRPLDGRSRGWWTPRIATYDLAMDDTLLMVVSLTMDFEFMMWWIVLRHAKLGKPAAMAHG